MCGITGFINKDKNKKEIIEDMAKTLIHRGPDGQGYYIDDDIALAHLRLAIIDLKGGKQPIYNEDKTKVIVYNGEVYNFIELRAILKEKGHVFKTKTDTEVLIHGYEEWNSELPKHLRGMFAFAIWDKEKKELFMARDQFGIKPLYYANFNDTFMFASEIKALIKHPNFKKELNKEILSAYLCFNSTPTTETFFKGVYRLEPGHTLSYKNGNIEINRYFKLEFNPVNNSMENIVSDIRKVNPS